jgi:uncharacterized protein YpmB
MDKYTIEIKVLKEGISENEKAKIVHDALNNSYALKSLLRLFNEKINIAESKQQDVKQGRSGLRMKDEETDELLCEIVFTGRDRKHDN